jgi:hypothetical protein
MHNEPTIRAALHSGRKNLNTRMSAAATINIPVNVHIGRANSKRGAGAVGGRSVSAQRCNPPRARRELQRCDTPGSQPISLESQLGSLGAGSSLSSMRASVSTSSGARNTAIHVSQRASSGP